jgi:dihydroneopterin aldolase
LDKIIIKGIEFYGYHGVTFAEQELGQRFVVDVELELPLEKAGRTDQLKDTVDYRKVYSIIKNMEQQKRYKLLEAMAFEIAEVILREFDMVYTVNVCIKKLYVPVGGIIEYTGVSIKRTRDNYISYQR